MIEIDANKHATIFSKRIKKLRYDRGWTGVDITLRIGMPSNAVYTYEGNARLPNAHTLMKFAKLFECSTDFLLGLTDKENS